jgi:hypothetical protein
LQLLGVCRFSLALEAQRKANKRNAARFGARGRFLKKAPQKLSLRFAALAMKSPLNPQFISQTVSFAR